MHVGFDVSLVCVPCVCAATSSQMGTGIPLMSLTTLYLSRGSSRITSEFSAPSTDLPRLCWSLNLARTDHG
jgi:hypothetical protein